MKEVFFTIISLVKQLLIIVVSLCSSFIISDFIFEINYISIPLSLYTTYCIHFIIKYHTSFYDIPYDHEKAYYKALREYEKNNMELVYGELVDDYTPFNKKSNYKASFDFNKIFNILVFIVDIYSNEKAYVKAIANNNY